MEEVEGGSGIVRDVLRGMGKELKTRKEYIVEGERKGRENRQFGSRDESHRGKILIRNRINEKW